MHRALLFLALVACVAAPPAPRARTSRGLTADQHLAEARDHARRAEQLRRWPELRRTDVGHFEDHPAAGLWYRTLDDAEEQQRMADVHRGEAGQLYAAYDEACAKVPPHRVRVSPLVRHGRGGMPLDEGVVVFLGPEAGPPDQLLAEIRCHRAWMMLSSHRDDCPLDLPNIRVQAHGDRTGISVEIRVSDPLLVAELQRRAAHDLELAQRPR